MQSSREAAYNRIHASISCRNPPLHFVSIPTPSSKPFQHNVAWYLEQQKAHLCTYEWMSDSLIDTNSRYTYIKYGDGSIELIRCDTHVLLKVVQHRIPYIIILLVGILYASMYV